VTVVTSRADSREWLVPGRLFTAAIQKAGTSWIMWDEYEHRQRRIRQTDIVAIWAIAAVLLIVATVWSSL
jgi:hypothetical protein